MQLVFAIVFILAIFPLEIYGQKHRLSIPGCVFDSDRSRLNCSNSSLTAIPADLPRLPSPYYELNGSRNLSNQECMTSSVCIFVTTPVKVIDLSSNPITVFEPFLAYQMKDLDLSYCAITYIHEDALRGFPLLNFLNLANNHIKHVPSSFTSISLNILDLSFNSLETIPQNISIMLPNLRCFYLNKNIIASCWVLDYFFKPNMSTTYIEVNDNPWNCNECCPEDYANRSNMNQLRMMCSSDETHNSCKRCIWIFPAVFFLFFITIFVSVYNYQTKIVSCIIDHPYECI